MDGWGIRADTEFNAVAQAKTPVIDGLTREYPSTTLVASGLDVGLPDGQMGNSEVGHLNLGAGRIVYQDYTRINKAIADGSFFSNEVLTGFCREVKKRGAALHIMGLLSDGGVHSHIDHIFAAIRAAHDSGIERLFFHAFLDGRDTPPTSGAGYMRQLVAFMSRNRRGQGRQSSGALLRHGSGQAVGSGPEGIRRHRARAGPDRV